MLIEKSVYEQHPRGTFPARIIESTKNEPNQFGESLTIKYRTSHKLENGENAELWERCSLKLSSHSKLGNRILNIMGFDDFASIPAEFETDDLVNQLCNVIVDHVTKDDQTYANIMAVVPFENGGTTEEQR